MIKIAMNLAGVNGGIQSAIDGTPRDTAGCVPLTVDFRDTIGTAQSYEWYFQYVPGSPPDLVTLTPAIPLNTGLITSRYHRLPGHLDRSHLSGILAMAHQEYKPVRALCFIIMPGQAPIM